MLVELGLLSLLSAGGEVLVEVLVADGFEEGEFLPLDVRLHLMLISLYTHYAIHK